MLLKTRLLLGVAFSMLGACAWLGAGSVSAGRPVVASVGGDAGGYLRVAGRRQAFVLKHTEVKTRIAGNIARVEVVQTFENPFDEALEATYVFPLPDEGAVDEMEIRVGERRIKGQIKKREEAVNLYRRARAEGRTAGLLEQERDNIFTQSLANIRPHERVEVTIRYTESVRFEKGDYEFVFPMVVAPRYIPGKATSRVPDAGRITPPVTRPTLRSGHDIALTIEIDAGVLVRAIQSTSHKIRVQRATGGLQVRLGGEDTLPNKDFILRYRVADSRTNAAVISESDERGGHFAVYLIPALEYEQRAIVPRDVVFLIDTSGSQSGEPLRKCQELMRRMVEGLNSQDTFAIVNFADATEQLAAAPLASTALNRTRALRYIDHLSANGGTELLNGIEQVLAFPAAEPGRLRSIVLLTDGLIGDDRRVIAEVQRRLRPGNRLYTFGVGSSVNRFLIDRLAEVGRGVARVVRQDEPTAAVAEKFFRQINNPVLTDIEVHWQGTGAAPQIYPLAAPDLFTQQPLILYGRKPDRRDGALIISGRAAGGRRYEQRLAVHFQEGGNRAIAQLWGRSRIKDLTNQMFARDTRAGVDAVTRTALDYHLLSEYTAFVAVSEAVRVDPTGRRRTVEVPVALPEGMNYESTVGKAKVLPPSSRAFATSAPLVPAETGGNLDAASVTATRGALQRPAIKTGAQPAIRLISATQMDSALKSDLEGHLAKLALAAPEHGEAVYELVLRAGRVVSVLLIQDATTLKTPALLDTLRLQLQSWVAPGVSLTTRVTLQV